ncbi:MAG: IS1182 family transposase [Polyangia bacterium]
MAKTFRPWDVEQRWLSPPSVDELVPDGHLAHFVRDTFRDELDVSAIMSEYGEERGFPPFHPVMMTALLMYAYCQGIYSSRRIAKACVERVDFMAVTGRSQPDFRTIGKFRKRHLGALASLFQQVLRLCQRAGMAQLGHVALDGTKIKANASKRKAMSYGRMKEAEPRLALEVQSWFDQADALDGEDDRKHGVERSGDELPDWVVNKEQRRQRIQAAMAQLEAEARKPDDDPSPPMGGAPQPSGDVSSDAKPADRAQLNFTDPESKIMKTGDGFIQAYNCQAAVDGAHQIIVACDVIAKQNDNDQLVPMLDHIRRNLGRNPRELSADCGYFSEANLRALRRRRIRGYVAVKKERMKAKSSSRRSSPRGPLAVEMRRRIDRGGYRSRYRLRKTTVEPVFGQVKSGRQLARFSLRGLTAVKGEWAMLCTAHNLLKLARR